MVRCACVGVYWCVLVLVYWCIGIGVHWCALVCWCVSVLRVCWCALYGPCLLHNFAYAIVWDT